MDCTINIIIYIIVKRIKWVLYVTTALKNRYIYTCKVRKI